VNSDAPPSGFDTQQRRDVVDCCHNTRTMWEMQNRPGTGDGRSNTTANWCYVRIRCN